MSVQFFRLWPRRPADGSPPLGLSLDDEGLLLAGNCRLIHACLDRDGHLFYRARPVGDLSALLTVAYGEPVDATAIHLAIEQIAKLMTERNWSRAKLAALHLHLRELASASAAARVLRADRLLKVTASFDPLKHPRWPKGSEEGHGGEFSPSDGSAAFISAGYPQDWIERDREARRIVIQRIDPIMLGQSGFRLVPGGGGGNPAALAAIVARMWAAARIAKELAPLVARLPTLKSYLEAWIHGPWDVRDLRVSETSESFRTMDAFRQKYGPAGEGWQYDHEVEQNPNNTKQFGDEALHSTDNIIRVPQIWHERMSAYYSEKWPGGGTVRDHVNSLSWDEQVAFKLNKYREWGVIK